MMDSKFQVVLIEIVEPGELSVQKDDGMMATKRLRSTSSYP